MFEIREPRGEQELQLGLFLNNLRLFQLGGKNSLIALTANSEQRTLFFVTRRTLSSLEHSLSSSPSSSSKFSTN